MCSQCLAGDTKPGLVEMLDRGGGDQHLHRVGEAAEVLRALVAHAGDGGAAQAHGEQQRHQGCQTFLGQMLRIAQIHHDGGKARTILHRRVHPFGKRRPRGGAAGRALAGMRAMFGHHRRRRGRQIDHLPRRMAAGGRRAQRLAAVRAGRRIVVDHHIRHRARLARRPRVSLLAAALAPRPLAQAACPRRLRQPVTGGRLAAVAAVEPKPALQFGYPRHQHRQLGRISACRCARSARTFPRLRP